MLNGEVFFTSEKEKKNLNKKKNNKNKRTKNRKEQRA